jgi:hypothetical protein
VVDVLAGIVLDGAGCVCLAGLYRWPSKAETCSRISTIKVQIQDSCVFRQSPPPSFDIYKHNGDDEPET